MESNRPDAVSASAHTAFEEAVRVVESQAEMAKIVGKTQSAVSKRLASRKGVWGKDVFKVEAATGVSRHRLRPDLYPDESGAGTAPLDHAAADPAREVQP